MSTVVNRVGKASFFSLLAALGAAQVQAGFNGDGATNIVNIAAPTDEGVQAVADEVLVVFKNNVANEQVQNALDRIGGKIKATKHNPNKSLNGFPDFHKVGTSLPVMQAVQALKNHPAVEVIEPNFIYQPQALKPNAVVDDFFYADDSPHASQFRLWGDEGDPNSGFIRSMTWPYNDTYGSQADEAWHLQQLGWNDTQTAIVGIIDEGVCFRHPDLIHNTWFNPNTGPADNETAADLLNHKTGDVNGWDFFGDDNTVYDDDPGVQPDGDQHGTHVAGTIGAEVGNGIGVAGIAGIPGTVKMISGKFLGPNGGDTADAIDAINYFIHLKHFHEVNIKALNNSWGGGGYSSLLHAAIIDAANEGILFVAAAGNGNWRGVGQNNDSIPSYPSSYDTTQTVTINGVTHEAGYDSVIAVAAIDKNGAKAGFSNYGATSVDIAAPGVDILSTYPWKVDAESSHALIPDPSEPAPTDYWMADEHAREYCYQPMSGTSMATPHVTGAAALYAFRYPHASAAAIKKALLDAAVPTSSMKGKCVSNGRLNLANIADLLALPEPATRPKAFKVAPLAKKTALISWVESDNETGYELQRSTSSSFNKGVTTINVNSDQSSYTDNSLTSGTTYYYRLRAITTVPNGNSAYTATLSLRAP